MSGQTWTRAEEKRLKALREHGMTAIDVAREMGRSLGAITNKIGQMGLAKSVRASGPPGKAVPVDPVAAERLRIENRRLVREEREALFAVANEKSLRAELERLFRDIVPQADTAPKWKPPAIKRGSTASVETAVQMFSDWHYDENVKAEAVRGFNEYNSVIAPARVQAVIDRHLSIKHRMEVGGGWKVPHLIVSANGDFVSGTIHELEKHSDHKNVVWAVYETGIRLATAIRDLAGAYETVNVMCTSGNHGRLPDARRIQQKEPTRNWDTMVYLIAREHLRDCPNVSWTIPDSYSLLFSIGQWTFGQQHGHEVKSWNSIPFYGINRLTGNLNAMEAARGQQIHYWLFGHFHCSSNMPHSSGESFINGSLIGATEFSVNALGKADRPSQWLVFVHERNGVAGRWPLLGETVSDAAA